MAPGGAYHRAEARARLARSLPVMGGSSVSRDRSALLIREVAKVQHLIEPFRDLAVREAGRPASPQRPPSAAACCADRRGDGSGPPQAAALFARDLVIAIPARRQNGNLT